MRRALIGIAVTAAAVLGYALPAGAAVSPVTHIKFKGPYAEADWFATSGSTATETYVNVSTTATGHRLVVYHLVGNLDAQGFVTSGTETIADVTSGFSFSSDTVKLTAASLSATGLPAQSCTFSANSPITDCTSTTISVSATWTGQGPITRGVVNEHFKTGGVRISNHINGISRSATASGSVDGSSLSPSDVSFAELGRTNSGTTVITR